MRLVSFNRVGNARAGLWLESGVVLDLSCLGYPTVLSVLQGGEEALATLRAAECEPPADALLDVQWDELLAPIPKPERNVFCIGRNYLSYAKETQQVRRDAPEAPKHAAIFTKGPNTVVGPAATIRLDPKVTALLDYEVELALVIGKGGRDIKREDAADHVWGYTVANDVTARDLQALHGQFFKGKSLDESLPMGPWIIDKETVGDPTTLTLSLSVNGEPRQEGRPDEMIFDIPSLIVTLSAGMALVPGDIVLTGTPAGVGYTMDPPQRLADGDLVLARIDRIGELRNIIIEV